MKCIVRYCRNTPKRESNVSFHALPKNELLRRKWLIALRHPEYYAEIGQSKVCSEHFLETDFFMAGSMKRIRRNRIPTVFLWPSDSFEEENFVLVEQQQLVEKKLDSVSFVAENVREELMSAVRERDDTILRLRKKLQERNRKIRCMRREAHGKTIEKVFSVVDFKNKPKQMLFYTGIPNYKLFSLVLDIALPSNSSSIYCTKTSTMSVENELFMVLIRLRHGIKLQTLADIFSASTSTVEKVFVCWINLLYVQLENGPHNVTGSIDCSEFFIDKPLKSHRCYNTSINNKSLLMTDTNGAIVFCSPLMSGSMSDEEVVTESGFYNKTLSKNISLLADKGFKIQKLLEGVHMDINILTFGLNDYQFAECEVVNRRKMCKKRIQVERAIGRLKQFKILTNTIPIGLVGSVNKICTVCCMLTNFRHQLFT